MRTHASRIALLATVLIAAAHSAIGQSGNCTEKDSATRPDCPSAVAFFDGMHTALEKDDHQALALMIHYPLRATIDHKQTLIRDQQQFMVHFYEIFSKGVRCEVLSSSEKDVWGNWQGFTAGDGAIWFDSIIPAGEHPDPKAPNYWAKYPFKIITINNGSDYPCAGS